MRNCTLWSMLFLVGLAAGAGCTPDFDEVYLVKDLRVLALQADPPEVLLGTQDALNLPSVALQALVVDPRLEPDQALRWEMVACTPEGESCADAALSVPVKSAVTPMSQIGADFTITPTLLQAAVRNDPLRGFGGVPVKVQLTVWPQQAEEEPVVAIKRLVYGFQDQPVPQPAAPGTLAGACRTAQPQCDAGLGCQGGTCLKQPNEIPTLSAVTADGAPLSPGTILGQAGDEVVLLPQSPEQDKETYWVYTFEGGTRELEEFLEYAFFITAGKLEQERTGGRPSVFAEIKRVKDLRNTWTLGEPGPVTLWIVVRDDRGGVSWQAQTLEIQ